MGLLDWFRSHGERRREPRIGPDDLVAYYWTGGPPEARRIKDIGVSGAFVVAPETFYPGTLIQMVLVNGPINDPGPENRIFLCARVLERRGDGFGITFPFLRGKERRGMRRFIERLRNEVVRQSEDVAGEAVEEEPALERPLNFNELNEPVTNEEKAALRFRSQVEELRSEPAQQDSGPGENAPTRRPASGQALIEFALILPLLFLLIVNVVNFGAMLYAFITVANGVRTGAQYFCLGGAVVSSPGQPSATAVRDFVKNDLASLPNFAAQLAAGTSQIIVCSRTGAGTTCVGGSATPPLDSESVPYSTLSVDVRYTYTPLIPLWEFPALHIHATLPPTNIHRQAVMRSLN